MMNDNGLIIRILIFVFLVLFGLLINSLALFKLITGWKRSSSTNVLAFNLLFVDILLLLSTVSLDVSGFPHYQLAVPIQYKAVSVLYAMHIHVLSCSVFTTFIFSVDKFKAMTRPFQYKIKRRDGLIRLATVHGLGLILSTPFLILQGTHCGSCGAGDCFLPCRIYVYILFICHVAVPFPSIIILQFKALIAIVAENNRTIEMSKRIAKSAVDVKEAPSMERSLSVSSRLISLPEKAKSKLRSISMIFIADEERDYLNELALHRRQQTISACKQFLCIILTLSVLLLPDRILTITSAEERTSTPQKYQFITSVFLCMSTFMHPFIYGGLRLPGIGSPLKDDRTTTQDLKNFQHHDLRRRRETVVDVLHDPLYDNSVSAVSNECDVIETVGDSWLEPPLRFQYPNTKQSTLRSKTTKAQLSPRVGPRIIVTEFHFTTDSNEDVRIGYRPQVCPEFLANVNETSKCLNTLKVLSFDELLTNYKSSPETCC